MDVDLEKQHRRANTALIVAIVLPALVIVAAVMLYPRYEVAMTLNVQSQDAATLTDVRNQFTRDVNSMYQGLLPEAAQLASDPAVATAYQEIHAYFQAQGGDPTNYDVLSDEFNFEVWPQGAVMSSFMANRNSQDLFLIDAETGLGLWTYQRDTDQGLNLASSKYLDCPLRECWQQVVRTSAPYTTDIVPYAPVYPMLVQFGGAPVYVDGELKAVLVMQFPVSQLGELARRHQWSTSLGEINIYMINAGNEIVATNDYQIDLTDISGGPRVHYSSATDSALEGESDVVFDTSSFHGEPCSTAYAPFSIGGYQYAVVAEHIQAASWSQLGMLKLGYIFGTIFAVIIVLLICGGIYLALRHAHQAGNRYYN